MGKIADAIAAGKPTDKSVFYASFHTLGVPQVTGEFSSREAVVRHVQEEYLHYPSFTLYYRQGNVATSLYKYPCCPCCKDLTEPPKLVPFEHTVDHVIEVLEHHAYDGRPVSVSRIKTAIAFLRRAKGEGVFEETPDESDKNYKKYFVFFADQTHLTLKGHHSGPLHWSDLFVDLGTLVTNLGNIQTTMGTPAGRIFERTVNSASSDEAWADKALYAFPEHKGFVPFSGMQEAVDNTQPDAFAVYMVAVHELVASYAASDGDKKALIYAYLSAEERMLAARK